MRTARGVLLLLLAACASPAARSEDPWGRIAPLFTPPAAFKGDFGTYGSVLTFLDGRPVRTPQEWPERREEILKRWHGLMGPWPSLIEKPKVDILEKQRVENFMRHKVKLEVAPGRTADAYLLVPDGTGPFPAILAVYYDAERPAGIDPEKVPGSAFGYRMAKRGFVSLCIGLQPVNDGGRDDIYYPSKAKAALQPLSYLAYVAANGYNALAALPEVDARRVGVVGHSYGGKWALFAGALCDRFAAVCCSDPGIVFDETLGNANYWDAWYLGYEQGMSIPPKGKGAPNAERPRTGAYKRMMKEGWDLHELHALIAPRPFFVSGGAVDPPRRWQALNRSIELNRFLGFERRVGMSSRDDHPLTPEANEQICSFFEHFLKNQ